MAPRSAQLKEPETSKLEVPAVVPPGSSAPRPKLKFRSHSLTGLYLLAIFYTIYLAKPFLLPLVLAVLFSYLLAPLVRQLQRWKIPPFWGATLVVALLVMVVVLLASSVITPASSWMEKAPYSLHVLKEKIRPFQEPVKKIREASEQIGNLTRTEGEKHAEVVLEKKSDSFLAFLMSQTFAVIASIVAVVILIFFMLAYGNVLLNKTIHIMPRLQDKKMAVEIARRVEYSVSRYLLTVAAINAGLGIVVGISSGLLGLPNPVLWGLVAGTLNFVPYIGALGGITAMTLAAVITFDLPYALLLPFCYLVANSVEGNFITPVVLGRSFTLNPVVIVVGLLFWGWIWGLAGMFVAVPILVILKIFCENIERLKPIDDLLSV